MSSPYPKEIKQAVDLLVRELEKHYPEIIGKSFDGIGFIAEKGATFRQRMEMGVYIELMKAGAFNNELGGAK